MRRLLALLALLNLAIVPAAQADDGPSIAPSVRSVAGVRAVGGNVPLGPGNVGSLPCTGTCAQLSSFIPQLVALVPSASAVDIETAITDAPSGADYLELRSGTIRAGGPLATFIQARYSLSSSQMTALLAAAGATTSNLASFAAAAADFSNVVPATGRAALGVRGLGLLDVLDTAQRTATGSTTPRTAAAAAADVQQGADNGMKCDGVTDDGPALQALVNRISSTVSPDIQLPWGVCLLNTAVTVSSAVVHLKGHGWTENGPGSTGTWLKTGNTAISPLNVSSIAASGTTLEDVGLAQVQPVPAAGWAPTVYPPFVNALSAPGFKARNIMGYGVYDGFLLYNLGRYDVSKISGEFFHSVVKADRGLDLGRITDIHKWPFWLNAQGIAGTSTGGAAVTAWEQANGHTIILGRQDGIYLDKVFSFDALDGVQFVNGAEGGVATGVEIGQIDCDSVVHCLSLTGAVGVTGKLAQMNSFGQAGVSSGLPYTGANAILVDSGSTLTLQGGDIRAGLANTNVIELDNTGAASTLNLHTVHTYAMAGATGSSVISAARTSSGVAPHSVTVEQPLNISLTSGSYLPGVNWSTTNAQIRIPGLDYQIIENATASQFNGNSYAIENARPKLYIEADDGNAIASMSLVLPKYPYDGVEAAMTSYVAITALTVSDPNGRPIIGSPTTLAAGGTVRFKWTNTGTSIVWLRQ